VTFGEPVFVVHSVMTVDNDIICTTLLAPCHVMLCCDTGYPCRWAVAGS